MSIRKTYLSRKFAGPFFFESVTDEAKRDIERKLTFITADRLAAVMDHIGQDKLVHVAGRSWKQISRYLKGDRAPTDVLQALADETGASMDWLTQGKLRTAPDVRYEQRLLEKHAGTWLSRLVRPRPEPEWSTLGYGLKLIDERLAVLDNFVPQATSSPTDCELPYVQETMASNLVALCFYTEVWASAGFGARPITERPHAAIALDRQFLRDLGANPDSCSIIRATGDSMQPTIPDGSMLVVDHQQSEVKNGHIMIIALEDDLLVKRCRRRLDGLVELISDNPAYPPETIGRDTIQQLRVVGRVVYFCRVP